MDSKTYQIEIFSVNPAHLATVIGKLKDGLGFVPKLGGKVVGTFASTIGAAFQILLVIEYPSLQARLDGMKAVRQEGSMIEFMKTLGEGITDVQVYFTKASPHHPASFPVNGNLILRRYDVKGLPYNVIQDGKKSFEHMVNNVMKAKGIKLVGAFMPVFGENTSCLFHLWDVPKEVSIDEAISSAFKTLEDKTAKSDIDAFYSHVYNVSSKVFSPLQ